MHSASAEMAAIDRDAENQHVGVTEQTAKPSLRGVRLLKHTLAALAIAFWSTSVAVGFAAFMNYESTPGLQAQPGQSWPVKTQLSRGAGQFQIVLLAHPRCPCTRAGLAALRELSLQCRSRADIDILFWMPRDAQSEWQQTSLWRQAAAIPGARVHADRDGVEARHFGAATSGQVLVYDATGNCIFRGGITAARGKFGESDGSRAVRDLISGKSSVIADTPVFGCPLCRHPSLCDQQVQHVDL